MIFHFDKMLKISRKKVLLIALFFIGISSYAQLYEFGLHAGYNIGKLTVSQNKLNDQVFVKAGRPAAGYTFGGQFLMSPPIPQSTSRFRIDNSILFEASLCRCTGNIELSLTSPNGISIFNELQYIIYRGDYSAKYIATVKKIQFMIGPTVSNQFYTGVKVGVSDAIRFAGDQFKSLSFGYEIGMGAKLNTVQLSFRYQRTVGAYGRETELIPTSYKNYQFRILLHYYFLRKHKGQYWDSIYWK